MEESDDSLLARYKAGDVSALETVVNRYRRPLYSFIINCTDGRDDADEIFQEAWHRAIRNIDSFHKGKFLSWMFRIARNRIIDRARKKKPDASLDDEADDRTPLGDHVAATGIAPATEAGARELGQRIAAAVATLGDEQREVFLLRTTAELPFKEIARIQDVSINTALARMQYALEKLRDLLRADYEIR